MILILYCTLLFCIFSEYFLILASLIPHSVLIMQVPSWPARVLWTKRCIRHGCCSEEILSSEWYINTSQQIWWHLFHFIKNKTHIGVKYKTRYLLYEPGVKLPNIMHIKPAYLLIHYSMKKLFSNFVDLSSSCQAPKRNLNISSNKHTSTDSTIIIGIPEKQDDCIYSVF